MFSRLLSYSVKKSGLSRIWRLRFKFLLVIRHTSAEYGKNFLLVSGRSHALAVFACLHSCIFLCFMKSSVACRLYHANGKLGGYQQSYFDYRVVRNSTITQDRMRKRMQNRNGHCCMDTSVGNRSVLCCASEENCTATYRIAEHTGHAVRVSFCLLEKEWLTAFWKEKRLDGT